MGTCFGECTFPPPSLRLPSSTLGNCLSSLHLCPWIAASGPDVCNGMGGCLDSVVFVTVTLGLPLVVIWQSVSWNGAWVLIRLIFLVPGLLLSIGC